jgi:hypothetical protein
MRSFVALGIAVLVVVLLAGKLTRHPRRVVPPPEPDEAPSETATPTTTNRRAPAQAREAPAGPTLRELLDKATATPAVIRGHARGPEGASITVRASLVGKRERGRPFRVEDGAFEISGLLFGRSYDLTFDGPSLRQTTLRSVTAPADDVEAKLDPLPVLRGAIGFRAGEGCAYDSVELRAANPEQDDSATVVGLEDDCRFELTVPDGPTRMVLAAVGDGPHLEMPVAIPPAGDPEPVCLNPPCLADPRAATARLRIVFAGAEHTDLSATLTATDGDDSSSYNCFTDGEDCELDALPIDQPFELSAEAADCTAVTRTIALHAGDNQVSLPCEPARSAEAAAKAPDEDEVQDQAAGEIQGEIVIQ